MAVVQAADIGCQIASGLSAAHDVGIIRRDIKPANVLLDNAGRVVVTDFGLARAVSGDAKITIGSAMIGTPSYMAPEQVRGEAVSPATDLYALGAVLYEMLTGTCPFVREGVVATAMARLVDDPEDPRHLASIPDDFAALVLECLERSADRRPASAAHVAATLAGMTLQSEAPDAATTLSRSATSRMPASRPARAPRDQAPTAPSSRSLRPTAHWQCCRFAIVAQRSTVISPRRSRRISSMFSRPSAVSE